MSPTLAYFALTLVGVDLGYQPATNGGTEFIIQISPATLQASRPGDPFEIDVPKEAQGLRPTHFRVTMGNGPLPHVVSDAARYAPATAPIVSASPVIPAAATSPTLPSATAPIPSPSSLAQPRTTVAHTNPLLRDAANPATSAESRFPGLAPVGNSGQIDRPWLVMCLAVIGLLASNTYVGWLFVDARQRYRGLLAQTFSLGQQAVEA